MISSLPSAPAVRMYAPNAHSKLERADVARSPAYLGSSSVAAWISPGVSTVNNVSQPAADRSSEKTRAAFPRLRSRIVCSFICTSVSDRVVGCVNGSKTQPERHRQTHRSRDSARVVDPTAVRRAGIQILRVTPGVAGPGLHIPHPDRNAGPVGARAEEVLRQSV